MVVKIDPPDQATRMEILRRKAKAMQLSADDDALQYVARHIHGSVREMEGALVKLAATAALEGRKVTVDLAAQALADHLARTDSAITLGDIEAVTAAFFGITPADIHSTRRTKTVSAARMVAMFLARRHTQMSYPEIGRAMGKNHSSVVLAVQRMEALLAKGGKLVWLSPMGSKSLAASQVVELITDQIA
jgi:chromosomal replication initiator protein